MVITISMTVVDHRINHQIDFQFHPPLSLFGSWKCHRKTFVIVHGARIEVE